jgi:hypothetical protein
LPFYFPATLRVDLQRTQKGYPALWEGGGGYSSTGKVQVIAGPHGEKKRPVYIRQRGELAGKEHALFVVEPEDLVVYVKVLPLPHAALRVKGQDVSSVHSPTKTVGLFLQELDKLCGK